MDDGVSIGDLLAGKYRVERILGSGAMGVVVAARHEQLDTLVALKSMAPEAAAQRDLIQRFLREARAAARLRGEHVARVTDFGTLDSGAPYLVMEYLEGRDLAAVLKDDGPLPIFAAVEYAVQACDALVEAHGAGIVHRDIKPSNLFLTRRPDGSECIKVLDFGISKVDKLGRSSSARWSTQSRVFLGSPYYMAPEQMHSAREVDARADIWALGATLYELLTGRVPFEAESLIDLAWRVSQHDPLPLRVLRGDAPWELEQLVLRCLAKPREQRFPDVLTLEASLLSLVSSDSFDGRVARNEAYNEDETLIARPNVHPSLRPVTNEASPPPRAAGKDGGEGRATLLAGSRVAWGIAGAATLCGLIAVTMARSPAGHVPGTPTAANPNVASTAAAPPLGPAEPLPTDVGTSVEAPVAVRPSPSAPASNIPAPTRPRDVQPPASVRDSQRASRPELTPVAPKQAAADHASSSAARATSSSPLREAMPREPPAPETADGLLPAHHAKEKPKVQLERDNPWP